MARAMRKLCKVLYGLATSGGPYDPARVSTCESMSRPLSGPVRGGPLVAAARSRDANRLMAAETEQDRTEPIGRLTSGRGSRLLLDLPMRLRWESPTPTFVPSAALLVRCLIGEEQNMSRRRSGERAGQEPSAPYSRTFCVCQFAPFVRRRSTSDELRDTEKGRLLTRRYSNCTALRLDIYPMVRSGSVARNERLSPHSDLDLAVEGLAPMAYDRAVARLQSIPEERDVDLVRLESCRDSLRQTIEETGIEL